MKEREILETMASVAYRAMYLNAIEEVRKAHKGIKRLKRCNEVLRQVLTENGIELKKPKKGDPRGQETKQIKAAPQLESKQAAQG